METREDYCKLLLDDHFYAISHMAEMMNVSRIEARDIIGNLNDLVIDTILDKLEFKNDAKHFNIVNEAIEMDECFEKMMVKLIEA